MFPRVTYGKAFTFDFPLVDFGATDYEDTPVTFAAGDTRVIKDGTAANAANNPVHIEKGIYRLTLTAAEVQAARVTVTVIDQTGPKEWVDASFTFATEGDSAGQFVETDTLHAGAAQAGGANTIQLAATASSLNNYYNDQLCVLPRAGAAEGQARTILSYVGATTTATLKSNWTTNPGVGTPYAIKAGSVDGLSLTGTNTITITINDAVAAAVQGVEVSLYDSANTTLLRQATTDTAGQVVFNLDDGTYAVRQAKTGYQPDTTPETLVVTADAGVTYTGVVFAAVAAASPLCTVSGFAKDASGVTHDGLTISFLGDGPIGLSGAQVTARRIDVVSGPTETNPGWDAGYFEVPLIRLATVRVLAVKMQMDLIITVPDEGSALLTTLTESAK